jgi:hypothetical protein
MSDVIDIKDRRKGKRNLPAPPKTPLPPLQDGRGGPPAEREPTGKVAAAKRRSEIMSLAVAGADASRIAEILTERYSKKGWKGIKTSTVQSVINRALSEMQESDIATIEKVRTLQLARLDDLLQTLYPKVRDAKVPENTKLRITDRILRLERLRSKIAGTEAPRKLELSGRVALVIDPAEVEREEQAWLNSGGNVIDLEDSEVQEVPTDA